MDNSSQIGKQIIHRIHLQSIGNGKLISFSRQLFKKIRNRYQLVLLHITYFAKSI